MGSVSSCITDRGAIVAVDFGHWDGPVVRGCGRHPASGYALLHAAGFTTAGDQHDGPQFICRLGDRVFHHGEQYPTAAQAACVNTPPASAYWSYWIAQPGSNTWSYSTLGAATLVPRAGSVELWTFGGTNIGGTSGSGRPRIKPAQLRAATAASPVVNAQLTSTGSGSGSPVSLIAGILLALALAAAAAWRTWNRRRPA